MPPSFYEVIFLEYVKLPDLPENMRAEAWEIYQSSFPYFELRNWETHSKAMDDIRFFSMGVIEEQKIIGIIFYWKICDLSYIEHFAISKSLRGQNYGTKILNDFCEKNDNVVLEIDPPIDEVAIKREHFYNRLGFVTSKFSYTHPSYSAADIPHTLLLMSYKKDLSEKDFSEFKSIIFDTIMKYSDK